MTKETIKRRRDWQALWSGVWGGLSLIIIGYIFWQVWVTLPERERFSLRALEMLVSYWPVLLVLIGISFIGTGVIRWYEGEAR